MYDGAQEEGKEVSEAISMCALLLWFMLRLRNRTF